MTSIFAEIIDNSHVAQDDDFFGIGGHSLLAFQIARKISTHFDLDVPMVSVFNYSTPKKLVGLIEELQKKKKLAAET